MIKAILFDFDGVIVNSNEVKTKAFQELFKDYPSHIERITEYHLRTGGISRYIKVRYIFEEIFLQELSEADLQKMCDRYSALVKNKVVHCAYIKGAIELL